MWHSSTEDVRHHQLTEFQPVEFSPYQTEHVMMSSWLVLVNESESDTTACFSERMWKNILSGRKPQGGKVLIKRDPQQWPSMDEINLLTGVPRDKRSDGYDYLCIEAPRTILVGRRYKQVTTSFTLPQSAANEMAKTMRLEFIRMLVKFIKDELSYCDIKGIEREITMCVNHFFFHYNICLGTNMKDRDTMRRIGLPDGWRRRRYWLRTSRLTMFCSCMRRSVRTWDGLLTT